MNLSKVNLLYVFFVALIALCGCVYSDDVEIAYYETSSSSSSEAIVDTIEYVQPPKLSCKENLAIRQYNEDGVLRWNYDYKIGQFAFWGSQTLGVSFDLHAREVYTYDGNSDNIWMNADEFNTYNERYSKLVQVDSLLLITRFSEEPKYGSQKLCNSLDFGKNWNCKLIDTARVYLASDEKLFYFQQNKQLSYSADGENWTAFSVPNNTSELENAFMKDDEHFLFFDSGDLYWTKDFVTWDSSHVPVKVRGTKVAYGNGVFVYAGSWSEIFYSRDLIKWDRAKNYGGSPWFNDIIFANGMFVAVGTSSESSLSKSVVTSYNGKDFERQGTCGHAYEYSAVYYDGKGKFYITQGSYFNIFQLEEPQKSLP